MIEKVTETMAQRKYGMYEEAQSRKGRTKEPKTIAMLMFEDKK